VLRRKQLRPLPTTRHEAEALGYWQITRAIGFADLEKPVPPPGHYGPVKRLIMKFAGYREPSTLFESAGPFLAQFLILAISGFLFFFLEHNVGVLYGALIVTPPAVIMSSFMETVPKIFWFRAGGWEQILTERTRIAVSKEQEQDVDLKTKAKNRLMTTGLILLIIMLPVAVTLLAVSNFVIEGLIVGAVILGLLSVVISSRSQEKDISEVTENPNE